MGSEMCIRDRFINYRREYLENKLITNDHEWDPVKLVDFSLLSGINDALKGDTRLELFGLMEGYTPDDESSSDESQ